MLSSWGRFGWRVESFGSASHRLPLAPASLAPTQPVVVPQRAPGETGNMALGAM
uniref:Uncharacterized protein n=1 Tax=Prolemur simus TaxID=1328070 RepID=A0A8C8YCJ6_PROSS